MRLPLAAALAVTLFAAAGCSPGSASKSNLQEDRADASIAGPSAEAIAAGPARSPSEAGPVRPSAEATAPKGVRRCGWLSNPTPANWWLTDSQDQWILATQGADQAPGMDEMPDMSTAGWIETNGHYGYGCACMTITADADGRVTRIADAQPKPLKQCRADRKLPKPE